MEAADFWNDPEVSQKKMKELKSMKDDVATYASLTTQFEDIETLIEMGYEENDATLIPEIEEMLTEFTATYDAIRAKDASVRRVRWGQCHCVASCGRGRYGVL